jgi:hypothetical protein
MLSEGARPNAITITTVFLICAKSGDLDTGKRVRALVGAGGGFVELDSAHFFDGDVCEVSSY